MTALRDEQSESGSGQRVLVCGVRLRVAGRAASRTSDAYRSFIGAVFEMASEKLPV